MKHISMQFSQVPRIVWQDFNWDFASRNIMIVISKVNGQKRILDDTIDQYLFSHSKATHCIHAKTNNSCIVLIFNEIEPNFCADMVHLIHTATRWETNSTKIHV
jgi:hypothetical protein